MTEVREYEPCPSCDRSNMLEQACHNCKDNCHYCCECDVEYSDISIEEVKITPREDENRYLLNIRSMSEGIALVWAKDEESAVQLYEDDEVEIHFSEFDMILEDIRRID